MVIPCNQVMDKLQFCCPYQNVSSISRYAPAAQPKTVPWSRSMAVDLLLEMYTLEYSDTNYAIVKCAGFGVLGWFLGRPFLEACKLQVYVTL